MVVIVKQQTVSHSCDVVTLHAQLITKYLFASLCIWGEKIAYKLHQLIYRLKKTKYGAKEKEKWKKKIKTWSFFHDI